MTVILIKVFLAFRRYLPTTSHSTTPGWCRTTSDARQRAWCALMWCGLKGRPHVVWAQGETSCGVGSRGDLMWCGLKGRPHVVWAQGETSCGVGSRGDLMWCGLKGRPHVVWAQGETSCGVGSRGDLMWCGLTLSRYWSEWYCT